MRPGDSAVGEMSERRTAGPRLGREPAEELRSLMGDPRWIRRLNSSPRSQVWLAEFDRSPVIVKQVTGGQGADERYRREVTALRLAARVRPTVVPALLATVSGARVLMLERLADDRPGSGWVQPWARALARLHASTGAADVGSLPTWKGPGPADVQAFLGLAGRLGVPVPAGVPEELEQLLVRLDPGDSHALLHGDPCPGNDLYDGGRVHFVDLGQAALGTGSTELAYLRIGFPTCWCAIGLPEQEVQAGEAAYRATFRSVTGSAPAGDLTDACAGWLIRGDALLERVRQRAPEHPAGHLAAAVRQDWRWGTATARERLAHRLAVVARLCAVRDDLGGVGWLSAAMHVRMRDRWPGLAALPARRPD
jgi:hypothetical protein